MGTNFYLRGWTYDEDAKTYTELKCYSSKIDGDDSPSTHIGKRSAAGPYCWDCDETLVIGGKSAIHHSNSGVYDECPKCGRGPDLPSPLIGGAAAVELGFAKPNTLRPTGVRSCSSFSWAQPEDGFMAFIREHRNHAVVISEYGDVMSGGEFVAMLESNCPVRYHEMIGRAFC